MPQVGQISPVGRVEKTPATDRPRRHKRQKRQGDNLLLVKQLVFQHISTHFSGSSFSYCPVSVVARRLRSTIDYRPSRELFNKFGDTN